METCVQVETLKNDHSELSNIEMDLERSPEDTFNTLFNDIKPGLGDLPNFELSVHTRELEELKKLETNVFLARIQDGAPVLVVDGKLCFL